MGLNKMAISISECHICFENRQRCEFMKLECSHELCDDCYEKLRSFSCPFCRAPIQDNVYYLEITEDYDEEIHWKKRQKKKLKKTLKISNSSNYEDELNKFIDKFLKNSARRESINYSKKNLRLIKNFI